MTAETSNARGDSPRDPYAPTDGEVLSDFLNVCRGMKPVGQWPNELVCAAIERLMKNQKPPRFIADADRAPDRGHNGRGGDSDCMFSGPRRAAAPPAAARGDVRGLVALAKRVQYADTHAQVSKDDAGEFVCLPPWLWLEIRDAAAEALAADGVQAGEVEQRALELLAQQYDECDPDYAQTVRNGEGLDQDDTIALRAIASALSQQPEAKAEARELLDARVIDSLINANEEIHAAAAELASCLAAAVAAGATDIPLTHRAGMALKKYESLTELTPKAEARGVVDESLRRDADRWRKLMANTKSDHIWHFVLSEEQKAGHDHFLDVIDALPLTGERNG